MSLIIQNLLTNDQGSIPKKPFKHIFEVTVWVQGVSLLGNVHGRSADWPAVCLSFSFFDYS